MTELDALQGIDADIHAAFADTGMAGIGFYTAPASNVDVRCRIYLNRAVQVIGEFGQTVARRDEMSIMLADVAKPAGKGRVLVESSPGSGQGEVFALVDEISNDGSLSRWAVRRV